MSKEVNWGLPLGSQFQKGKLRTDVDESLRNKDIYSIKRGDDWTPFSLADILLKELIGTYQFNTDKIKDEQVKKDFLRQENKFWWTLYFDGQVGIWKLKDRPVVVRINRVELNEFDEVKTAFIQRASATFDLSNSQDTNVNKEIVEVDGKDIVVFNLDATNVPFILRYKKVIANMIEMDKQYRASNRMRNKKLIIMNNQSNQELVDSYEQQMLEPHPFIRFESPQVKSGMETVESTFEDNFEVTPINNGQGEGNYISIDDMVKDWKFNRDILGMNESVSQKKAKVISTEIEESKSNTILMSQAEIRNQQIGCEELKEKFSWELETIQTVLVDERLQVEDSEQAGNEQGEGTGKGYEQETV